MMTPLFVMQISGLLVQDYAHDYSHWNSEKSLSEWLQADGVSHKTFYPKI